MADQPVEPEKTSKKYRVPPNFKDLVNAHLAKVKSRGICSSCGTNNWAIIDKPASLNLSDLEHPSTELVPCVALICEYCGYARLFSLGSIDGLRPDELAKHD